MCNKEGLLNGLIKQIKEKEKEDFKKKERGKEGKRGFIGSRDRSRGYGTQSGDLSKPE